MALRDDCQAFREATLEGAIALAERLVHALTAHGVLFTVEGGTLHYLARPAPSTLTCLRPSARIKPKRRRRKRQAPIWSPHRIRKPIWNPSRSPSKCSPRLNA